MSYRRVGDPAHLPCEVCAARTTPRRLRRGGVLDRCTRCGHLRRSLDDAPADHRDAAYGGEATLDRIRLAMTHRTLTRSQTLGRPKLGDRPRSVFEIGYGTGALLRRFLDEGSTVSGVDPDQLRLDVDPLVAARGDLHVGLAEELPEGLPSADLVIGIHVLEHVVEPTSTLAAAHRVCRPGGDVVFLTPGGDCLGPGLYGSAWWMLEDPTHVRFFTAESLTRAAIDAGFVDVRVDRLVLDSLSSDVASLSRLWPGGSPPEGALSRRSVLALGLASAPVVALARLVAPRLRPTLRLRARRPVG